MAQPHDRLRPLATAASRIAALALLAALVGVGARASVFGRDDRHAPGASTRRDFHFVGLLYVPDGSHSGGTATLVAPTRIATAAHLLFDEAGELRAPIAHYRFRVGSDFVNAPWEEAGVRRVTALGSRQTRAPGSEHLDWVVLELERPLESARPAPLAPDRSLWRADRSHIPLEMAAYHRDVADGVRRVRTRCRVLPAPEREDELEQLDELTRGLLGQPNIVVHDCDSSGLSSGAGLFLRGPGRLEIAAINIGKLGPERSPAVDFRAPSFNVAVALDDDLRRAVLGVPGP